MSELPLVLITGAANGIGRATALELARSGVRMGLIDIDAAGLEALASELRSAGATFVAEAADVSRRRPLLQAVKEIEAALGPVDVLVACAGFGTLTLVPDLALDTLRRTFEVNMFGVAESIEAVLPGMLNRGRGHIVGVASLAGYRGFPWMISYSASKAALDRLPGGAAPRPGAARHHRDDRLPGLRPHRDEHRSSLQAQDEDARAGAGRAIHLVRAVLSARGTASSPGPCGWGWPSSSSCRIACSTG